MATTKILIELEIEGDPQDAYHVVDAMLDNGCPQDDINDHEHDDAGPLRVKSAVCHLAPVIEVVAEAPPWMKRFRAGQAEQLLAAENGFAEGAADYRGRARDVASGAQPAEWAWPMEGADDAYLQAVGVTQICGNSGLDPERFPVVSETWLLAFRAGYTEAHDADAPARR
jgi:hypothetical protein